MKPKKVFADCLMMGARTRLFTVLITCRHARFCRSCADKLLQLGLHCPICRASIQNIHWTTLRNVPFTAYFLYVISLVSFYYSLSLRTCIIHTRIFHTGQIYLRFMSLHYPWLSDVLAFSLVTVSRAARHNCIYHTRIFRTRLRNLHFFELAISRNPR